MAVKKAPQAGLEKRIRLLDKAIRALNNNDLQQLLIFIRRPGWTTPAEQGLVSGIVTALTTQVKELSQLKADLVKGSATVGR